MERSAKPNSHSAPVNRGGFTPALLETIRERISLADLVSPHVKLKRRGREYVGLSPFNAERTPSFTIVPAKRFFHCFSSGEHGDVIDFVMKVKGLTFPDAVRQLAARAGIEIPQSGPGENGMSDARAPATASAVDERDEKREAAVGIWSAAERETAPVGLNMAARGAWPPDLPLSGCIRWLTLASARRLDYRLPDDADGAAVYAFGLGKVTGVQVEPMTLDGRNAPWPPGPKGGKPLKRRSRGVLRGSPMSIGSDAAGPVRIAEGPADALAAVTWLGGTAWVSGGTGFLPALVPMLAATGRPVEIFADDDRAGREAATKLQDSLIWQHDVAARLIRYPGCDPAEALAADWVERVARLEADGLATADARAAAWAAHQQRKDGPS